MTIWSYGNDQMKSERVVYEIWKNAVQYLKKSWYSFLTWLLYFINLYFLHLSNMLRGLSGREGGGEDTLARVSCPPPSFMCMKS